MKIRFACECAKLAETQEVKIDCSVCGNSRSLLAWVPMDPYRQYKKSMYYDSCMVRAAACVREHDERDWSDTIFWAIHPRDLKKAMERVKEKVKLGIKQKN